MEYLTESEKLIIKTLARYVLISELEEKKFFPKEMWREFVDGLTDIQKAVVALYEDEKRIVLKEVDNF